jgi:hypothetical protein
MKKTLAALSGSLLNVGTLPEAKLPPENYRTRVTLEKVTAYLGSPLVRLVTGKDPLGLVPITFEATGCLLIPAGSVKTMISLEGSDTEERSPRERWIWKGSQNSYGKFKSMLAQQTSGDEMSMLSEDKAKWKGTEDSSTFDVEMAVKVSGEPRFWELEPSQFIPPKEADSGAALAPLPCPWKPPVDATTEK